MKLIGLNTRGILCGREEQMVASKSGTVGFLQQIARQNHAVHTSKLKNARMKLTGFDRRGILHATRLQMVPSKSRAVEFLRQIERGNPVLSTNHLKFGPLICATALNARCSTEQKQVITDEAPVITHLPGEEKSVELDEEEGGSGFPPDASDGSSGGGNWFWSGAFFSFFFGIFVGFLEDKKSEIIFHCDDWGWSGIYRRRERICTCAVEDWEAICYQVYLVFICYCVYFLLYIILVWDVPLAVPILGLYNLLTGLTGRVSSDWRLSRLLNWRYRLADSSSELASDANENLNPECCCICLAEYEDNEETRMLHCSHVFHLECINQWLRIKSFCPLCKRNVQ